MTLQEVIEELEKMNRQFMHEPRPFNEYIRTLKQTKEMIELLEDAAEDMSSVIEYGNDGEVTLEWVFDRAHGRPVKEGEGQ